MIYEGNETTNEYYNKCKAKNKIGISGIVKKKNKKGEIEDIELTGVSLNKKIEPNFFGSSNHNITTKEK